MERLKLLEPTEAYLKQIKAYRAEFSEGKCLDWMHGAGGLMKIEDAREWLEFRKGETGSTQFLYVRLSDQKVVGMINIGHTHTEPLSSFGGHIGYSVCPSERRKGYATSMLREALTYCRKLGLNKVLLTCGQENTGSLKAILANGGVFECNYFSTKHKIDIGRYWIDT